MANAVSTAGLLVKYAPEATAGTRPTSGFTTIPGVKAIPAFGDEVNTLQSTPLSATKNHTYIAGLADPGGAIQLTVNDYQEFRTAWETFVTAAQALTGGKKMWIEYAYPEGSNLDSFYFPATPHALGFGGAEVDSVLENMANLLPEGDFIFAAPSGTTSA